MIHIGEALAMYASNLCFLSNTTRLAATRLAIEPKTASTNPMGPNTFTTAHPAVTPLTTGNPNKAVNAIRKSKKRNCIGPQTGRFPKGEVTALS